MNPTLMVISGRNAAISIFNNLWNHAFWAAFFGKLSGKYQRLAVFPDGARPVAGKTSRKTREVRINQIIGTMDREDDFDHAFRPLKAHLRDRWASVYLHQDTWPPVILHKIGSCYYVEDGHHRISVANAMGLVYIQAIVHEYVMPANPCPCKTTSPTTLKRAFIK